MKLPDKWKEWTITDEIGEGSFGKVYEIIKNTGEEGYEDFDGYSEYDDYEDSSDIAALKVINIPEGYTDLFLNEIRALTHIKDNKYILDIYDYHLEDSTLYIMMPLAETLVDYAILHSMDEEGVVKMGIDLCQALAACDQAGILHRDIKPDNIMVDQDTFLLGDFGFAVFESDNEDHSVKGTYTYMAPEVYNKKKYGHTADIYSLGLVMYMFLNRNREPFIDITSKIPLYSEREKAIKRRFEGEKLPAPSDASPELSTIILKACHPNPKKRYQHASQLLHDLKRYQTGDYHTLSPAKKLLIGLIIAGGIMAAAWFIYYSTGYSSINQITQQLTDGSDVRYKLDRQGTLRIWNTKKVPIIEKWNLPKKDIKTVILDEGIETIGQQAFLQCSNLEYVQFPSTLKTIEIEAFADCEKLQIKEDNIPKTIDMIEVAAFSGTAWEKSQGAFPVLRGILTDYLPGQIQSDDSKQSDEESSPVSYDKTSSDHIIIPDQVHVIGSYVFRDNESIHSVYIPDSVDRIGKLSFLNCHHLQEIGPMKKVKNIGFMAFENTPWIENQGDFVIVNDILIDYQGEEKNVQIPDYVHTIAPAAFIDNKKIKSITIPDTVKNIDKTAFVGCSSLGDIKYPSWMDEEDIERVFGDTLWFEK